MKDKFKPEANLALLKGESDYELKAKYITIEKFNSNYHKYVSDTEIRYVAIPVSAFENLYFILPREILPKIFQKIHVKYKLELLRSVGYSGNNVIHSQDMSVNIDTPHSLFTFLFNLEELVIFNVVFNIETKINEHSQLNPTGPLYAYNISSYSIDGAKPKSIYGLDHVINDLCIIYDMDLSKLISKFSLVIYDDKRAKVVKHTSEVNITLDACKDAIISKSLMQDIPIHTFISKEEWIMIKDATPFFESGVVEYGYGNVFKNDDWTDPSDTSGFIPKRTSTRNALSLIDFTIYTKMAVSILRVTHKLLSMINAHVLYPPIDYGLIPFGESTVPYFSYNFKLTPYAPSGSFDSKGYVYIEGNYGGHYVKDFVFMNESDIYRLDIYGSFIKDIEGYILPW